MKKTNDHTGVQACRHCGNSAPMQIVASYDVIETYEEPFTGETDGETVATYQLCLCPACSGLTLREIAYISPEDQPPVTVLYPGVVKDDAPRGIPDEVRKAYLSARKVRDIDANAYAVLLGRVLEKVCQDRSATGKTLATKLASLSAKGEIPGKLSDVAQGLRQLRNVGAHADLGELTDAEVPVLDNLTRAILEYLYTAPLLVSEAEKCLKKLQGKDCNEAGADCD